MAMMMVASEIASTGTAKSPRNVSSLLIQQLRHRRVSSLAKLTGTYKSWLKYISALIPRQTKTNTVGTTVIQSLEMSQYQKLTPSKDMIHPHMVPLIARNELFHQPIQVNKLEESPKKCSHEELM